MDKGNPLLLFLPAVSSGNHKDFYSVELKTPDGRKCQSAGNWQKEMKRGFLPADIFTLNLIQPSVSSSIPSESLGKKIKQWLDPEHVQWPVQRVLPNSLGRSSPHF